MGDKSVSENIKVLEQNSTFLMMVTFSFSVGLATGLMFWSDTYHFLTNKTTIESSVLHMYNPFDKGYKYNWR